MEDGFGGGGAGVDHPIHEPLSLAYSLAAPPPSPLLPAFTTPLRLSLAASPSGRADIRLGLVQSRWGAARVASTAGAPLPPRAAAAVDVAARVGALLYARLALPSDSGRRLVRTLAAAGAARAALPASAREAACVAVGRAAKRAPPALAAAATRALDAVDAYVPPSLALATAGALLALISPPSAAALQAVAAAAPVAASYAATARAHATGALRAGADLETAWRRVHRRAALALAPHLTDLPAGRPPLAWALDVWDAAASVAVGGAAATAVGDTPSLALSIRLPGRAREAVIDDKGRPCSPRPKRPPSPPPRALLVPRSASPPPRSSLYGAADHATPPPTLPPAERVALAARAAYLAAVFAPFAVAGPLLLLLAAAATRAGAPAARARACAPPPGACCWPPSGRRGPPSSSGPSGRAPEMMDWRHLI